MPEFVQRLDAMMQPLCQAWSDRFDNPCQAVAVTRIEFACEHEHVSVSNVCRHCAGHFLTADIDCVTCGHQCRCRFQELTNNQEGK